MSDIRYNFSAKGGALRSDDGGRSWHKLERAQLDADAKFFIEPDLPADVDAQAHQRAMRTYDIVMQGGARMDEPTSADEPRGVQYLAQVINRLHRAEGGGDGPEQGEGLKGPAGLQPESASQTAPDRPAPSAPTFADVFLENPAKWGEVADVDALNNRGSTEGESDSPSDESTVAGAMTTDALRVGAVTTSADVDAETVRRPHLHVDEDCWFCCAACEDCCDDHRRGPCDCGADRANAALDRLITRLRTAEETAMAFEQVATGARMASDSWQAGYTDMANQRDQVRAERDRYKAALGLITNDDHWGGIVPGTAARRVAYAALANPKTEEEPHG